MNLLPIARANPAVSAYSYVFGEYNFVATPMAPPGTKVVANINAKARTTWKLNGDVEWYVEPSMNQYECVERYLP